jgi:tungstate transport system ATP-binding protein
MPAASPLLTLRGAGVRFGQVKALDAVDLVLRRGDRLAVLGSNGSGKTTLLRLLLGLADCSSGAREASALQPEGRMPVPAMLFQRPFLLSLSVRTNLRLALWLRGVPRSQWDARLHTALHRVGLDATARRPARALSGGQQQRLALARAITVNPDLLCLDEPTANLDPHGKREVESLIAGLARSGMTLVMSTHNLGRAKRLATRVLYLEAGRLIADRPVDKFFSGPLPAAAAAFLKGELPWM